MKPIHVAATIVRLFAICLVVYALNLSVSIIMLLSESDTPSFLATFSVLILVTLLIISLILWNFPVSISRKLTGIPPQIDDEKLQFNGAEFLSICIFSISLYFLYGLVGEGVYWYKLLNDPMIKEMQTDIPINQKASLWAFAFRAVFVLLLLIGNRLIVKAYKTLRYGG